MREIRVLTAVLDRGGELTGSRDRAMKHARLPVLILIVLGGTGANAAEIGHFAPGVLGIRDFSVPDPGLYGVLYNYYYTTDPLNDADGNRVDSITVNPGPGPGVTLDLEVDVHVYAVA